MYEDGLQGVNLKQFFPKFAKQVGRTVKKLGGGKDVVKVATQLSNPKTAGKPVEALGRGVADALGGKKVEKIQESDLPPLEIKDVLDPYAQKSNLPYVVLGITGVIVLGGALYLKYRRK